MTTMRLPQHWLVPTRASTPQADSARLPLTEHGMASPYPFTSALITGASSGIGMEMAKMLDRAGLPQGVVASCVGRLEELAARHSGIEVLAADLTTAEGL